MLSRPRNIPDVKRVIERRITKILDDLGDSRARGETLDVEYLRGQLSELEFMQSLIEALPLDNPIPA